VAGFDHGGLLEISLRVRYRDGYRRETEREFQGPAKELPITPRRRVSLPPFAEALSIGEALHHFESHPIAGELSTLIRRDRTFSASLA
jgi:hypothetical protein